MEQASKVEDSDYSSGLGGRSPEAERIVYCIVPRDLEGRLLAPLEEHFRDDPWTRVLVDQRSGERRLAERRSEGESSPPGAERRRARRPAGRRFLERRADGARLKAPADLPRRARRHADRLLFVAVSEPDEQAALDAETDRLVARFQAGDPSAMDELYRRWYRPIYSFAVSILHDHHEAEDLAQWVFLDALEALPGFEIREGQPLRAWLFSIARNRAVDVFRHRRRVVPEDPVHLDERLQFAPAEEPSSPLPLMADRDLQFFLRRLSEPQREVVVLHDLLDVGYDEVAELVGRSKRSVYSLHQRALKYLETLFERERERVERRRRQAPACGRVRRATVLRGRLWALGGTSRAGAMVRASGPRWRF